MIASLESTARHHAISSSIRSVLGVAILILPWFFTLNGMIVPWVWAVGISLLVPTIILLTMPLAKVGDMFIKHLRPHPPTHQFENVVTEIAIGLNESVESIQIHDSKIANIAMIPCSNREIVVATTGALERLSRNELQALVAAQFAGMRDRWCRLATKAEIMWWAIPWVLWTFLVGLLLGRPAVALVYFLGIFVYVFMPRWTEQARDLCADVAAVRTTFDPQALANSMRKLAEQANAATNVDFGAWYLPNNPFLVIPRRLQSQTTVNGRKWSTEDEVRLELLLRADRAEALANGADPCELTGQEFRRRWGKLGS